ncbi:MAG: hypothetical protein VYC17_03540 [Nitrospinota bacterium]|nr:hypothetical protein [Nitrospinota bacterium]
MAVMETSAETKVKILLDEANLAFCETAERKDLAGERSEDGSAWERTNMEGEYDEQDFQKILALQLKTARICDDNPDLEQKTADLFQTVTPENAEEKLKEVMGETNIVELAKASIVIFLLRFPNVESFTNKGHPLVMAADEYMLENSDAQNWQDYKNIARDFGWD